MRSKITITWTGCAKLALALAALVWMISSGRLDPRQILVALQRWPLLAGAIALGFAQIMLATWRWQLLMNAQQLHVSYGTAFSLNMIGALFNVVIPGSVGGDLMKAY